MSLAASCLRFTMIKVFCSVKRDTSESIKWTIRNSHTRRLLQGLRFSRRKWMDARMIL